MVRRWRPVTLDIGWSSSLQAQATGTYAPGDVVVARMEFERSNDWSSLGTGNRGFRLTLRAIPSFNEAYGLNHISGDAYPTAQVPMSGVLQTPPFTVPAGTGAGGLYVVPEFAGVGTVRFGRGEIRKVA